MIAIETKIVFVISSCVTPSIINEMILSDIYHF